MLIVIDRFSAMVHLVPTRTTISAVTTAEIVIREVVRLHGLPESIVSDRDPKFVSQFWRELHRVLGVKLMMSSGYHPQTDGASERAIRTATQIMRAFVESNQSDWEQKVPLVEYAMNSAISSSLKISPFEVNYGWSPTLMNLPKGEKANYPGVTKFVELARINVLMAHDTIISSRVDQTHDANHRRRAEPPMAIGDRAYVSTADMNLPKGRARKLTPKYVGPYEIIRAHPEKSTYELRFPPELVKRRIHPVFHVSKLRPHVPNDDERFPGRESRFFYDFGDDPEAEWVVASIDDHKWSSKAKAPTFKVNWEAGDSTWEPLSACQDLRALEEYLELMGVAIPTDLPKRPLSRR
jgi:hypothetical protein